MAAVLGIGKRFTLACQPSDAKATTQWCNATPQLRINSRPSGSVLRSCISGLENSSRLVGHTRHRHGCVLWMEGPDGQGENRSHGFGVREMGVHGCRAFPINGCGHLLRIARRQPRWQSTKARQRRTFGPASTAPRSGEWY